MTARDDILVSVCFAEARPGEETLAALRGLAARLGERFRYWELLLVADADVAQDYAPLMGEIPNVRLLKVRRGAPFYRRRAAAASEAIGDVVVLSAVEELGTLDMLAMIEDAERTGGIVIGRRRQGSLLNPALRALGGGAGFLVDARDTLTAAYPRTLLNKLLAHPDRLLALRFPPNDPSIPVTWRDSDGGDRRELQEVGRRLNLVQRLMVSSAPRVLSMVSLLSLLVILSAIAFSLYAMVVVATMDPEPGWFTTSIVLSLTAFFLGCAILGLSMGLQKVIELLSGEVADDVVDEQSSGDLFGQVMQELNVEVDATRAETDARGARGAA